MVLDHLSLEIRVNNETSEVKSLKCNKSAQARYMAGKQLEAINYTKHTGRLSITSLLQELPVVKKICGYKLH